MMPTKWFYYIEVVVRGDAAPVLVKSFKGYRTKQKALDAAYKLLRVGKWLDVTTHIYPLSAVRQVYVQECEAR